MTTTESGRAGWYTDPTGHQTQRYYDGTRWTEHTTGANGAQVSDPISDDLASLPAPTGTAPSSTAPAWSGEAPTRRKRRVWPWVLVGLLVLGFGGCAAVVLAAGEAVDEVEDQIAEEDAEEAADVTSDIADFSCERDITGLVARGTLTNQSSERSSYIIEVTFEDASGTQIATATGISNNVDAGQPANWEAPSLTSHDSEFTCEVAEVERFAS